MQRRIWAFALVLWLLLLPVGVGGAEAAGDNPWEDADGGGSFYHDYYDHPDYSMEIVRGVVLEVQDRGGDAAHDFFVLQQVARVEILKGKLQGQVHTVYNEIFGHPVFDLQLVAGQEFYFMAEYLGDDLLVVHLSDHIRDRYTNWLVILFLVLMVVIGRTKGLKALLTLALTAFLIWKFFLPLLAVGYDPILLAISLTAFVTLVTLLVVGGLNRKSYAAVLGTVGGILIAGFLALVVGGLARLTGFNSQEAQMLQFAETGVTNIRGILFAGILIGSLGAIMDVSMSIASACMEMVQLDTGISRSRLIKAGMNVGRDIMGTMSNTLILAYTGSAIPMLLLFYIYETPVARVMNMDIIATEVVRAISGTIGLVVAIPLTALLAGLLMVQGKKEA